MSFCSDILALDKADIITKADTKDPHPLPPTASSSQLLQQAIKQIESIATNPKFGDDSCAKCIAGLEIGKFLAMAAPEQGPALATELCLHFNFSSTCTETFSVLALGSVVTQVIANADVASLDGQVCTVGNGYEVSIADHLLCQLLCQNFVGGLCPLPPTTPLDLTGWFAKPKPDPLPAPKKPSGKRLKVLHMSDLHIDASTLDWCILSSGSG